MENMNDCMPRKGICGSSNGKWGSNYHNLIMSKKFWQKRICSQSFNYELNIEHIYGKRLDHNWWRRMGFPLSNCELCPSMKKSSKCHVANIYDECWETIFNLILKWNIIWIMALFRYAGKHNISYSFETIENFIENCWGCPPFRCKLWAFDKG